MTGPGPARPDLLPPPPACPQAGTQAQSRNGAGGTQSPGLRPDAGRAGLGAVVVLGALVPEAGEAYAPVYPQGSAPLSAPQVLADVHVFMLVSEGVWGGLGAAPTGPRSSWGPTHFIFSARCSVFSRMAWDSCDTGFSIRLSKITCEDQGSARCPGPS